MVFGWLRISDSGFHLFMSRNQEMIRKFLINLIIIIIIIYFSNLFFPKKFIILTL